MISPGDWVETRFGKAVAVEVLPHDHCLTMRQPRRGHFVHPCEDDRCAGASLVYYRYKAFHYTHDVDGKINGQEADPIWVLNGDLTAGHDAVTLRCGPTQLSRRVLKLTGPYGRG